MKEHGEKRVFLPEFIQFLTRLGAAVFIEEGYGSRSGFTFGEYQQGNKLVKMADRRVVFQKDLVMVLRCPLLEEFKLLRSGSILMSMLHYPTRPTRVEMLRQLGLNAISLDSIVNDGNLRLVENMQSVAWNGLEAAFGVLEERWPGVKRPDGEPIYVLVLGTGMVGKHAVDAATKLGNVERNSIHIQEGGSGVIVQAVGRNISGNKAQMEKLFRRADILVDATQRRDTSRSVVPNSWIAWLPEHAVVSDLAVDPYLLDVDPPVVRGVEGIPQGNLDQYVFPPDDPDWSANIPDSIPSTNRRTTVSCYSWPGIHAETCMRHYALQLEPLMKVLLERGYGGLSLEGGYFERALYRATLRAWVMDSVSVEADLPSTMRKNTKTC